MATGVELIPFSVTFLCCLFINVEYGILIGAGFHLVLLAYMGNRPHPIITRLPVTFTNNQINVIQNNIVVVFDGRGSRETMLRRKES